MGTSLVLKHIAYTYLDPFGLGGFANCLLAGFGSVLEFAELRRLVGLSEL